MACLEWAIPVGGATVASRSRPVLDLVQERRAGTTPPERERLQTLVERDELNDLYGSTLCTCCSSACPSFWWKPNKYVGQAGLLQDYRGIAAEGLKKTLLMFDFFNDVAAKAQAGLAMTRPRTPAATATPPAGGSTSSRSLDGRR